MTRRIDLAVTAAMVIAAVGLCASYVYRSVSGERPAATTSLLRKADWSRALTIGRTLSGDSAAAVTMVVFTDLQCPVCRAVHMEILTPLLRKYPHDLKVLLVHYPLSYHSKALPAAKATECVSGTEALRRWVDIVFSKQDSLPTKSIGSFAFDAGIADTARIAQCAIAEGSVSAIDRGMALGRDLGIRGTPTVLLNGRMLASAPTILEVDAVVADARAGHGR